MTNYERKLLEKMDRIYNRLDTACTRLGYILLFVILIWARGC